MDVSSIALQGLQKAQVQLQHSAISLAIPGATLGATTPAGAAVDTVDLSQRAVSMISVKAQVGANIDILKIADDMQKSLLNVLG